MKIVTAAIIIHNGKILIAQRKHGKNQEYLWEFPGGKQEAGETLEECLHREIMEELRLDITVEKFFTESRYDYESGSISLHAFLHPAAKAISLIWILMSRWLGCCHPTCRNMILPRQIFRLLNGFLNLVALKQPLTDSCLLQNFRMIKQRDFFFFAQIKLDLVIDVIFKFNLCCFKILGADIRGRAVNRQHDNVKIVQNLILEQKRNAFLFRLQSFQDIFIFFG